MKENHRESRADVFNDATPCAEKIWSCKIGETNALPMGADAPMRAAVRLAYEALTGEEPAFIFSGWGAELTEPERAMVENREPRRDSPPILPMCTTPETMIKALVMRIYGLIAPGPAHLSFTHGELARAAQTHLDASDDGCRVTLRVGRDT